MSKVVKLDTNAVAEQGTGAGDPPTRVLDDGTKVWEDAQGVPHRDGDEPALVYTDGALAWYRHGLRHRDGGPAFTTSFGYHVWYRDGRLHRDDGPAITWRYGTELWFINGEPVDPPEARPVG